MNYNHLNKVYDYWRNKILPHLVHNFTVTSFDEYLKRFAWLPSGKWLKEMDKVKLNRLGFAIDPEIFVKTYKPFCVAYNAPMKAEDGIQRVIYQISPTFHFEMALWVWIEHEALQAYSSLFICYNDENEFLKFSDELYKIRKEGNTEENPVQGGFSAFMNQLKMPDLTNKTKSVE